MSFYRKLEKLQNSEEAQGKIVIVRCGAFFVSIGKDAVVLSLLLGLNVNCLNIGVCKVGIPVKYMMKYIDELEKIGHSFLIYDYEKNRRKYILKYSFEGVSVEETDKCFNCKRCMYLKEHGINNDFDIFEALSKKQEEYIMYLYESLKNMTYKHGTYTAFYVTEPKVRKVEKAKYIDRIVNRWLVDYFLKPIYIPQFIENSYACIEKRGMHKACLDTQKMMRHCKRIWGNYYILKMDVRKFFDSINKNILVQILSRKIKDKKVMWLIKEILFVQTKTVGIEIRKL